ncbi:hypothetical protein AAIB48_07355 [Paraclostridium benzoelyticum]
MIDITELKFEFMQQGESHKVDFVGLCHITEIFYGFVKKVIL